MGPHESRRAGLTTRGSAFREISGAEARQALRGQAGDVEQGYPGRRARKPA
jgi:hypothetical protein